MEMFPEASPDYLKHLCMNKTFSDDLLNELITKLLSGKKCFEARTRAMSLCAFQRIIRDANSEPKLQKKNWIPNSSSRY